MSERLLATPVRDDIAGAPAPDQTAVASLLLSFQKTLKAFRLYPTDHPALTGFIGDFQHELEAILTEAGEVTLRVAQARITCSGEVVYESPERDENLAFRLFIHGVRELCFHRGVPVEETTALAQILHRTLRSRTTVEDLLSLLWEKDFSYITFVVLEDFLEDVDQPEFARYVEEVARREPEVSSLRATIQPVLSRLLRQARPGETGALPGIFHLDPDEDGRLRRLLEEERGRDMAREIPGLVLPVMRNSRPPEAEELLTVMLRALQSFLADGAFRSAAGLVAGLKEHLQDCSDPGLKELVETAVSRLSADRILADIRPYLVRVRDEDLDHLALVLSVLGPAAQWAVAGLLDDEVTQEAGVGLLRRAGSAHLSLLLTRLAAAPPGKAVALLRILGEIGDPRALSALGGPLMHADPTVRHEAWRALRRIGTADAFPHLREILLGPDPDMRCLALSALESLPPACYRDTLLSIAERPDFPDRPYAERREVFAALGRTRDHATEEFLLRTLRRRSFFSVFRRQASDELRACAIAGLAVRGSDRALEEIRRCVKDRSRLVRQAAVTALGQTAASGR